MQLGLLKQLAASLMFHVARERIDAPVQYGELVEWFGPLADREAALRNDNTLGVDAHVRKLVERAGELSEPPEGIALVPALRRSSFECGNCVKPPCGESSKRNAQNLIHAKRWCVQYVVAHFEELRDAVADLVRLHVDGIELTTPDVRLEFDVHTAGIGEPVVASHRRQGGQHVVTLAIDITRFTRRAFHAITAELYRVLLCKVWDGAADPAAVSSEKTDPFIEGWMAAIATKALEEWLDGQMTVRARTERSEEARRLLGLRNPAFELGEKEGPGGVDVDIRTGVRVAQNFPEACVRASLTPGLAWELTLRWSIGLLMRRPSRRENVVLRPIPRRQVEIIISNFARDRNGWRFDKIWTKVGPSFV